MNDVQSQHRQAIINEGKLGGYKASEIDRALRNNNLGGYNPITDITSYTNLPSKAWKNFTDLGPALTTAASEFIAPIARASYDIYSAPQDQKMQAVKKAFADTVNNERVKKIALGATIGGTAGSIIPGIGTVGGAITGGLTGLVGPKNMADAILNTYGTSIKDIISGNVNYKDVAQGIFNNPLYVGMDVAGVGGIGKSIGKGAKALAGKTKGQIFTGEDLSNLNREIRDEKLWASSKSKDMYRGYQSLQEMPMAKRNEIHKYIATKTGKLSNKERLLATQIKNDLRLAEQKGIDLGLFTPEYSRDNTVAQYVMNNIQDKSNLLHMDIMDIINGRELRPIAQELLNKEKNSDTIAKLIDKGYKLYDEGDIALVSQKLSGDVDPLGNVIARHVNVDNGSKYARIIGRASNERVGNVLDDTIKQQLDAVSHATEGTSLFNNLLDSKNLGVKLSQEQKKLFKDEFLKSLENDVDMGVFPDLSKALNNSAINKVISPEKMKALEGAFDRIKTESISKRSLNHMKKAMLANPSWISGNRLGNWSNNAIEGVKLSDYSDIAKYEKYIPDVLKQQTSYNSYLNIGAEGLGKSKAGTFFAEPISKLRSSIGRFANSKKTYSDIGSLVVDMFGGTSDVFANPFFKAEAALEFRDRAANFIRQAKREAKATGKSVKSILKESNNNKQLFFKLNDKVNKSLGDYIGQNYAAPKALREVLTSGVPFYRFINQTGRTTLHQMANRPLSFASNISIPARIGKYLYEGYLNGFGFDPNYYTGGVPYRIDKNGNIITTNMTPVPLGIIAGRNTPMEILGMMNPIITTLPDVMKYEKFGRTPTSKELTKLKLEQDPESLKYKGTKNNDWLKYLLDRSLNVTYTPYALASRYKLPIEAAIKRKGLHKKYDTDPFTENPETMKLMSDLELLGNIIGISTKENMPNRNKLTKSQNNKLKSQAKYTRQNIERNK